MSDPHAAALRHLNRRDRILKQLIRRVGPCTLRRSADLFAALVRSIVAQQISTKAAASISQRLIDGPCKGALSAQAIVDCEDEILRSAGLSGAKSRSVRHLAEMVHSGTLRLDELSTLADEEVIAQLIPVRGVGRWTAQMFLIFSLGRPDVLPVDDFGLKVAVQRQYGLEAMPEKKHIEEVAAPWRPYASIATWYMWRSLDPVAVAEPKKEAGKSGKKS
jgi:DNA-3-methyladenine glycosylase II